MAKECCNPRLGKVGGEAVLEGVMMRCGDRYSIASRQPDGSITVSDHTAVSVRKKHKILNLPLIRGVVALVESFALSFKVLSLSAEALGEDLDEPETKFEKWLMKTFGDKLFNVVMAFAGVLGVLLAVGLFFVLPTAAARGVDWLLGKAGLGLGGWFALFEGIIRIGIFVGYILLVSLMKDIRRTFEYHGAEHKSIACFEAGEELTPENAKKHTRFHPRCGTSFIFVMLILSILVFSLPFIPKDPIWLRLLIKLPLFPVVCGLGYEFIMYAGKHENRLTKVLSAPGLWMQRITTREPDLDELAVAISALKASMPQEFDRAELDAYLESTKPQSPEAEPADADPAEPASSETPAEPTGHDAE